MSYRRPFSFIRRLHSSHSPNVSFENSFLLARYGPLGYKPIHHVIEPDLDFRARLSNSERLQRELLSRGYSVEYVNSIPELADRYSEWWTAYVAYRRANAIAAKMGPDRTLEQAKASELKQKLRQLGDIIVQCVRLPNELVGDDCQRTEETPSRRHMDILDALGLVRITTNPDQLFLLGKLVRLQHSIKDFIQYHCLALSRRVSLPHLVRPAIVEASTCSLTDYGDVTDRNKDFGNTLRLVGVGLPAFLAAFCRKRASPANFYPILMHSSGVAYSTRIFIHVQPQWIDDSPQSLFHCPQWQTLATLQLNITNDLALTTHRDSIAGALLVLRDHLRLPVTACTVSHRDLTVYESSAVSLRAFGAQLARFSLTGAYLSRRVQLVYADRQNPHADVGPLLLNYGQFDCTSIAGALVEQYWTEVDCSRLPYCLQL